ncbi:MAG: filamentous hemagglutinin N-terminal domain-containing protein, partial [Bryobacteraceae bacterium]
MFRATMAICAFAVGAIVWCGELRANPQGGTVAAGSATIGVTGPNTLTINQTSGKVIINWQDFSINAGEVTRFVQPSATAAALNRVVTANPSLLYGTLQANGRIFLINQNGILVGKGGQINTAGFTASTLALSDSDFLGGKSLHFVGESTAAIDNLGAITALGGDVFLIAQTVQNSGAIHASAGEVGLAAGSDVTLVQSGNERLSVLAGNAGSAPSAVGVNNVGEVTAAVAELKAAGGNIYALAINNGGVVRATGVASQHGQIVLKAAGGNIQNSGTLAANNQNGSGGTVIMDG